MILIAGAGTYWASQTDIVQSKQKSSEAIAQAVTLSISSQINILQETVSNMAASPTVIAAIESENPILIAQTATLLEQILPSALKIRILPADVRDLDESSIPHMGNADLVMAQETLVKNQPPFIQGQGEHRHLAITAAIKKNNVPIGIILASLKFNFLQSILSKAKGSEGFMELKQSTALLAKVGKASEQSVSENKLTIPQTSWDLLYRPTQSGSLSNLSLIVSIISITALIACLVFFISYRNLLNVFRQDQGSILKVIKDLMSGKNVGSYPVRLNEMKAIISTVIQYKRVLDNGGQDIASVSADTEIDDFFEEPTGFSFLDSEIELDVEDEESNFQVTESTPIASLTTKQETVDVPAIFATESEPESAKKSESTIFRAYDIRGIAGKTLTKEIIFDIGRAIASEAKEKKVNTIVIGRDGRSSSPALCESIIQGITSTGINVLDLGLVPSPVVYFVTEHTEGKSGIVITGSHNPAEYNGIKIIINGETLALDKINQLKQRIETENYLTGEPGTVEQNSMFVNEYIGTISDDIHMARPMKIVIDCGNGAAGELAPTLLKTLGCEVVELFCEIDGTFPNHHPDPSDPKNLSDLITAVQHYEADIGLAFDGDGDRLGVVDCKGKIIWPDRQMMLFAKDVLASKPGTEVIYDVKCSRHLGEQIVKSGGRPLMWKTGHSLMKAKIKETGASLAGEMSGHIFFNDRWFGFDDALYSASRLIEILSADTRGSDEVFSGFPDSINTPEINVELAEGENTKLMEQLLTTANFSDGKIINIDGMRVEFADGWGLVRASNTMPCLVLRFEAENSDALKRIQSQFKELLTKVKPDITLSF